MVFELPFDENIPETSVALVYKNSKIIVLAHTTMYVGVFDGPVEELKISFETMDAKCLPPGSPSSKSIDYLKLSVPNHRYLIWNSFERCSTLSMCGLDSETKGINVQEVQLSSFVDPSQVIEDMLTAYYPSANPIVKQNTRSIIPCAQHLIEIDEENLLVTIVGHFELSTGLSENLFLFQGTISQSTFDSSTVMNLLLPKRVYLGDSVQSFSFFGNFVSVSVRTEIYLINLLHLHSVNEIVCDVQDVQTANIPTFTAMDTICFWPDPHSSSREYRLYMQSNDPAKISILSLGQLE